MSSEYVAALQLERAMCARRGQKDRVAAIDAELKKVGAAAPEPPVETATVSAPETTSRPRAARKSAKAEETE